MEEYLLYVFGLEYNTFVVTGYQFLVEGGLGDTGAAVFLELVFIPVPDLPIFILFCKYLPPFLQIFKLFWSPV